MDKLRPLTLPEFTDLIGKPLCIRAIKPRIQHIPVRVHSIPWLAVITQVWQDIEDGEVYVQLGNAKYTNKVLWNAFEYAVLGDKAWVCTPTGMVKNTVYVPFGKSTEEDKL